MAENRLAIIPLNYNNKISERDYTVLINTIHKTASQQSKIKVMAIADVNSKLKQVYTNNLSLKNAADARKIGKILNASLLVFGETGLTPANRKKKERAYYYLNLYLFDVNSGMIINKLFWELPYENNLLVFTENATLKLLGVRPEYFPIDIRIFSDRKSPYLTEKYFDLDLRNYLSKLHLPSTAEIDYVALRIYEKKDVSTSGCIGCATLIGWIFLPFYETKTRVELEIGLHYLANGIIQDKVYKRSLDKKESFHLMNNSETMYKNTIIDYNRVKCIIMENITSNPNLFEQAAKPVDGNII